MGLECGIASALSNRADSGVKGFGCSDCECGSHLFYFSNVSTLSLALRALVRYGVTVERVHQPSEVYQPSQGFSFRMAPVGSAM
jgi:hypothetical protein